LFFLAKNHLTIKSRGVERVFVEDLITREDDLVTKE